MSADHLSADDAAILNLESAAVNGHTLKVLVLDADDQPLDLDHLRDHVLSRLWLERRAAQRIEIAPDGRPCWVDDDAFDIDAHIDRCSVVVSTDDPDRALREVAGLLMQQRLDHRRPLWHLDLVGPLADGREAIVARVHHAMADGITAMRMLETLLAAVEPGAEEHVTAGRAPVAALTHERELRRLPGTVRRELLGRASRTRLDQHIGPSRSVAWSFLPLEELRRIAHSRSPRATVNDVLLAVVAGALAQWAPLTGSGHTRLRAQVPVSLHQRLTTGDAARSGNVDSFLNVDLPVHEVDPLSRIDQVRNQTSRRKKLNDATELYDFFHAVSRLQRVGPTVSRLASSAREWSLSISNVPGPSKPMVVLGRRVQRIGSVAEPADHHALRISAMSAADTLAVGLCADPSALGHVDQLADAVDDGLSDLRAYVER